MADELNRRSNETNLGDIISVLAECRIVYIELGQYQYQEDVDSARTIHEISILANSLLQTVNILRASSESKIIELQSEYMELCRSSGQLCNVYTGPSQSRLSYYANEIRIFKEAQKARLVKVEELLQERSVYLSQLGLPIIPNHDTEASTILESLEKEVRQLRLEYQSRVVEFKSIARDFQSLRELQTHNKVDVEIQSQCKSFDWILKLDIEGDTFTIPQLTQQMLDSISKINDILKKVQEDDLKLLRACIEDVESYWSELNIEPTKLNMDLWSLTECQNEIKSLENKWSAKFGAQVDILIAKADDMLVKCMTSQEQKANLHLRILDKYTIRSRNILNSEIRILEIQYHESKDIYHLIEERVKLLARMKNIELNSSNSDRLFGSSFKLLEEEKFRKTSLPSLLKLESSIRKNIQKYERQNAKRFCINESDFLTEFEFEISRRFINESVFILDPKIYAQVANVKHGRANKI